MSWEHTPLRNPVAKIRFAGWESTTVQLQREGWTFAAQQDWQQGTVRLALNHAQASLHGLTNAVSFRHMMSTLAGGGVVEMMAHHAHLLEFDVQMMASNVRVMEIVEVNRGIQWSAIDAFPCSSAQSSPTTRERRFEEMVPFIPINHEAEQIVIAPESVNKVLDLLLKCQAPAAAARRVAEAQRGKRAASNIQAQVLVEAS